MLVRSFLQPSTFFVNSVSLFYSSSALFRNEDSKSSNYCILRGFYNFGFSLLSSVVPAEFYCMTCVATFFFSKKLFCEKLFNLFEVCISSFSTFTYLVYLSFAYCSISSFLLRSLLSLYKYDKVDSNLAIFCS